MDRDEFMELIYEAFADMPDNVLANGIIEAADAYVEYEKAQFSKEGTTSDLISRREAIKAVNNAFDRETLLTGFVRSIAVRAIRDMPSAQPERKIYSNMTAEDFEEWLRRNGICHPNIHEDISCSVVPLLIDDAINEVLSAQPERKKGKWVHNSPVTMKCNRCGLVIKDWDWHRFKICPNCGADMRGERNG